MSKEKELKIVGEPGETLEDVMENLPPIDEDDRDPAEKLCTEITVLTTQLGEMLNSIGDVLARSSALVRVFANADDANEKELLLPVLEMHKQKLDIVHTSFCGEPEVEGEEDV